MSKPKILLDPDDFDALHFSFLSEGGVGASCLASYNLHSRDYTPYCVLGHAAWLDNENLQGLTTDDAMQTAFGARLRAAGLSWSQNDDAVGLSEGRISFEEFIKRLNIDVKESN